LTRTGAFHTLSPMTSARADEARIRRIKPIGSPSVSARAPFLAAFAFTTPFFFTTRIEAG